MRRGKKPPQMGLLLIAGTIVKFTIGNLFKDYFSSDFFALCKSSLAGTPFSQSSTSIYICRHEQPLNFCLSNKDNCRKHIQILTGAFEKPVNVLGGSTARCRRTVLVSGSGASAFLRARRAADVNQTSSWLFKQRVRKHNKVRSSGIR